jgi:hypothetical protein
LEQPIETTENREPLDATDAEYAALERKLRAHEPVPAALVDAAATSPLPDIPPLHRALCLHNGCKCGATYRSTTSGAGIVVLERYGMDLETSLGVGAGGRPECPNGHGEMAFADEQLPIEQAITQVNERLADAAKPTRLPFPAPPFNYEGALHAIFEKRDLIAALGKIVEDRKQKLKDAKDDWEHEVETLGKMIDEFRTNERDRLDEIERRQRQAEAGHPDGTTLVRCLWEQQNQGEACPLCSGDRAEIERFIDGEVTAPDAPAHLDQVVAFFTKMDIDETEDAIETLIDRVPLQTIVAWTPEERAAVRQWCYDTVDHQNGMRTDAPERPAVLGRSHLASSVDDGAAVQACSACGAVLQQLVGDTLPYEHDTLVGIDCPGAETEPTHRYPETKAGKKPAAIKASKKK